MHLQEATRVDPVHADSHHNLAVALAQAGAFDDALASSDRAATFAPEDPKITGFRNHLRSLMRK